MFFSCDVLHRGLEMKNIAIFDILKNIFNCKFYIFLFSNSWIRIRIYLKLDPDLKPIISYVFANQIYLFAMLVLGSSIYMNGCPRRYILGTYGTFYLNTLQRLRFCLHASQEPVFLPRFVDSLRRGWDPDPLCKNQ